MEHARFLRPVSRAVPYALAGVALLYAARTVTRNNDWQTDGTLYRSILQSQADSSLMRTNLGVVYFNDGQMEKAEHQWLQALTAGPTNVFVLNDLGLLRERQHRYLEALDYFERALRARPVYMMAHLNLAETLAAMDRTTEADWQYRIATALSPLSTRAHNHYGSFLLKQGRTNAAQAEFERSVNVDPTAEALDHLGDIYLAQKDYACAQQAYGRAIGLNPFDSQAHFGLGRTLEATRQPGEALHEFEKGLETDPSDARAKAAANRIRADLNPKP